MHFRHLFEQAKLEARAALGDKYDDARLWATELREIGSDGLLLNNSPVAPHGSKKRQREGVRAAVSRTHASKTAKESGLELQTARQHLMSKISEHQTAVRNGTMRTSRWVELPHLPKRRSGFQACVLQDGRILVAGGDDRDALGPTALDDVSLLRPPSLRLAGSNDSILESSWEPTSPMSTPRSEFAMGILHDGRVIVAGGCDGADHLALNSAECYDPETKRWERIMPMRTNRVACAGVVAADGCFVVTGGENAMAGQTPLTSVEAYDPKTNTWSARPPMQYPRADHSIVTVGIDLLVLGSGRPAQAAPDQNPLVVLGSTAADWIAPAEMYDSAKKKWFALPMQVRSCSRTRKPHASERSF